MSNFEERFDEKFTCVKETDTHYYNPWLKDFKQFFKEELKRITDEMIGEEEKITDKHNVEHFINCCDCRNGDDCLAKENIKGNNRHRQHCIDIIKGERLINK